MSQRIDTRVSAEWARRPDDQRFLTVDDLLASVEARRRDSTTEDVALDAMVLQPQDDGAIALTDRDGARGGTLTNWAFGQLCQRAKAPPGYLRRFPAMLAATMLQWSLETHEGSDESNDAKLLIRTNGHRTVAAANSPTYGRIWDRDLVRAVKGNVNLDEWHVPAASYSGTDPKRATTLYASDRDVFLFLVNDSHTVDCGGADQLTRGFYVWNSEVGSAVCGMAGFTLDRVCDNRIIWGQGNFTELRIRHTSGGPHRFVTQAAPQIAAYANAGTGSTVATVRAAKAREVAKGQGWCHGVDAGPWIHPARSWCGVHSGRARSAWLQPPVSVGPRARVDRRGPHHRPHG